MELEALLAAARADRQARDDLFARARPYVRALLRREVRRPEDASDLTNDVQLRMHKGLEQFRGESRGQFIAWARAITANVLRDYYRRCDNHPTFAPLADDPPARGSDAGARLGRLEDIMRLSDALDELGPDYRVVIEARLFEGLSPQAIAERLGWPAGRVRVYTHRAVEALSRKLRAEP